MVAHTPHILAFLWYRAFCRPTSRVAHKGQNLPLPCCLASGRLLHLQFHTFSVLLWPGQVYTGVEASRCAGGHHLAGCGARRRQRPNRGVHPAPTFKNLATPAQMACLHRLFHQGISPQQISLLPEANSGKNGAQNATKAKKWFWLLSRRKWSVPQPARRFPAAPPLFTQ